MDKFNPQPSQYIFMTNNVKDGTLHVIEKWMKKHSNTMIIIRNFPKNITKRIGPYGAIALVRQILLNTARKLNVDKAIFIDDDIQIADKDFITKMIANDKDIVGGAYFRTYPMGDLMSYLAFNETGEKAHCPYILRNYQLHKLFKVVAVGGGCMCIGKEVLMDKRVNFYPITEYYKKGTNAEDYAYCVLAGSLGYEVFVDDRFKICHYQEHTARSWRVKEDGSYIDFEY